MGRFDRGRREVKEKDNQAEQRTGDWIKQGTKGSNMNIWVIRINAVG